MTTSSDEPDVDYGYTHLREEYQKLEADSEFAKFLVLLTGTYDEPVDRTFEDIQKFRTIATMVYTNKEIEFIRHLEPGQIWTTVNMGKTFIGVVQRKVNRTVYLRDNLGNVYHATADQFRERLQ